MRTYTIDELDATTVQHLEERLLEAGYASDIEKLFWLPLEEDQLSALQQEHKESCGPHCLALEVLEDGVRLELLIRAKGRMRCECVHYASPETQQAVIARLNALLEAIQTDELEHVFGTCC
ncbi:MAG: hypothetical protein RRY20_03505 [Bilophila sp.]